MKKSIFNLPVLLAATVLLMFSACKKETTTTEDDSVSAQDAAAVSRAVSTTSGDGDAAAGQVSSFSGKTDGPWWNLHTLCGATITDTTGGQITISYNGSDCNGITRSGSVTITLTGGKWKNPGATINIAFNNLTATDPHTGNAYTLNGNYTLTNQTGGLAWQVVADVVQNTTVAQQGQTPNSGLTITFPNGTQRQWTVNKTISYISKVGGMDTVTISEYSQAANNVDIAGTNRYGTQFTHIINDTISADNNVNCQWWAYAGETTYEVGNRTATILYGTNSGGQPDGSPSVCPQGSYITYTKGNRTTYLYVPYQN